MLENLYTTKMSISKKKLRNRFEKMNSHSSRLSKLMTVFTSLAIAGTILCANIVMAMVDGGTAKQYEIKVTNNNQTIEFENELYFQNNTLYLPLRELLNKIGALNAENAGIIWDNGKITINMSEYMPDMNDGGALNYRFGIEIGKAEYTLNPGSEDMYQQKWNISNKKQMKYPPVLVNALTYIPYEYVEWMINKSTQGYEVNYHVWDTEYNSNTDRKADFSNDVISEEYYKTHPELSTSPEQAIKQYVAWPCKGGVITAAFGTRTHPISGEELSHNGVDISAAKGTEILAASSGTVFDAGFNADDGNYIVITADDTVTGHAITTIYKHLDTINVTKGSNVNQGDIIATAGSTGKSTGPHLHFEIKIGDTYYDPEIVY